MCQLSEEDQILTQEERDTRDDNKQYQSLTVDQLIAVLQWQQALGRGTWKVDNSIVKDGSNADSGVTVYVRSKAQSLNIRYYDGS